MTTGDEIRMNIYMLGQLADILTTYVGVRGRGAKELNPIMNLAFKHCGFTGGAVLKLVLAGWYMKNATSLTCAISWFGPINNIIALLTNEI